MRIPAIALQNCFPPLILIYPLWLFLHSSSRTASHNEQNYFLIQLQTDRQLHRPPIPLPLGIYSCQVLGIGDKAKFLPRDFTCQQGVKRQELGDTLGPGGYDILCGGSAGWGATPIYSSSLPPGFLQLVRLSARCLVPNLQPHCLLPSLSPRHLFLVAFSTSPSLLGSVALMLQSSVPGWLWLDSRPGVTRWVKLN